MKFKFAIFSWLALIPSLCFATDAPTPPQWQSYFFQDYQFGLDSPYPLQEDKINSSKEDHVVSTERNNPLRIIAIVSPVKVNSNQDLQAAATVMLETFEAGKHMFKVKVQNTATTCYGHDALLTQGSFEDAQGHPKKLKMVNVSYQSNWWRLTVSYDAGDEQQETMSVRVVNSFQVRLENPQWRTFKDDLLKVSLLSPYELIQKTNPQSNIAQLMETPEVDRELKIFLIGSFNDKSDFKDLPDQFFSAVEKRTEKESESIFSSKKTQTVTVSGLPTWRLEAEIKLKGVVFKIKGLVLRRGPELLFIQILEMPSSEESEKIADAMLTSVRLFD